LKKEFHNSPLMAIPGDLLLLPMRGEGGGEEEHHLLSHGGVGYFIVATRTCGGPTSTNFPF
jgi:hypothetical protein